jgi:Ca2+-dependent lipid-binding protein
MGVLTIKLIKCDNLKDADFIGKTDPYVKISLEQDNFVRDKDYGTQISSTKSGDRNPVWNETFTFNVDTLNNMVLSLNVFDDDVGSKDDKCGKCKVKLENEDISSDPTLLEKTIDFNLLSRNGTISFEVSFEE